MASGAPFDIGTLITCRAGVYGGEPCLAGTRFPVSMIAAYANGPRGINAIFEDFPFLDQAHVYAAMTYYYANKEAFDLKAHEDDQLVEQLRADASS